MRLIDADALENAMYYEAFETDSDMQKWDSGCWIRYKMFEKHLANAPTVSPWIPCSVEMPISDGIYIVDDRRFGKSWIHTVGYVKKSNSWCEQHGVYYDDKYGRYGNQDKIVAWAYLPQPWKGEKK